MGTENGVKVVKIIVDAEIERRSECALKKLLQAANAGGLEIPENAVVYISACLSDLSVAYQVGWRENGATIYFSECTFVPGVEACRFGMFRDSILYNQARIK